MARQFDVAVNPLQALKAGIGRLESGNNYAAMGPEIARKKGTDRAYGKYQVMGANIPSWTEQALGRKLTPFEFLNSPEAQEAVFEHQMGRNLQKYGNLQDAASVWFSGRPLAQAQKAGAHDINIGVSDYVAKALGGGQQASGGVQVAGGDEELFRRLQARAAQRLTGGVTAAPEQPVETPEATDAFARLRERAAQRIAPTPLPQATTQMTPPPLPPIPQAPSAPAPAVPQDVWGPGQEFLNALTIGASRAALPYTSEQVAQMRKAYETEHPYQSAGMEIGGGVVQGLGLALLGPELAGAALGSKALQAIPGVSKALPFVERLAGMRPGYAGPFPSGGYVARPGMVEAGKRIAAGVGVGGAKGAGQAALNVGVHPDVPVGEQIALGGTVGALAEPAARYVGGMAGPAMAPHIEEPVRDVGKLAQTKFGVSLMPWQLSNMPAEQQLASKLLTPELAVKQAKEFQEAVGQRFGHTGPFTPQEIAKTQDSIGQSIGTIAQGTPIDLTSRGLGRAVRRDIDALVHQAITTISDPADLNKVLRTISNVDNAVFQKGLRGDVIQNLVQKNGTINHGLPPTSNALYQFYNTQLQRIADKAFEGATIPGKADAWRDARRMYKTASMAEEAATVSGILDPKKFASAAEKRQATGDVQELQNIGNLMFGISEKGAPIIPAPQRAERFWENPFVQIAGAAAAPAAAGIWSDLGSTVLSQIGFSPWSAAAGGAALAAGRYGGAKVIEATKHAVLKSPTYQRAIMQGKVPFAHNVLTGPVSVSGAVSAAETQKARRRK